MSKYDEKSAELCEALDALDAAHAEEVREAREDGYQEGLRDARANLVADRREGWVELPRDADGVPIHVGDKLTDGEYTFTAYELAVYGDGSWSIRNEDGNAWAACDVTHHHAPTVEDVLQKLLEQAVGYSDAHTTVALNAIAEFSAKLRLADDGEEEW